MRTIWSASRARHLAHPPAEYPRSRPVAALPKTERYGAGQRGRSPGKNKFFPDCALVAAQNGSSVHPAVQEPASIKQEVWPKQGATRPTFCRPVSRRCEPMLTRKIPSGRTQAPPSTTHRGSDPSKREPTRGTLRRPPEKSTRAQSLVTIASFLAISSTF
jgi:hypothetical protein